MEQDIPAFKPQWLMQGQVTATGAASLWAAASPRPDYQGRGGSLRNRSSTHSRDQSVQNVQNREQNSRQSSSRRCSGSNGPRRLERDGMGKSRGYGNFGKNREKERDKDFDSRDRESRSVTADRDGFESFSSCKPERDRLNRVRPKADTSSKGVVRLSNGGSDTGVISFEREFPQLSLEDKNGRHDISSITTPIQRIPPITAIDGWNSVLADVPLSSEEKKKPASSSALEASFSNKQSEASTALSMAKTVMQAPLRANVESQLSVEAQKMEEITLRQNTLRPMTSPASKTLVTNSSKTKGVRNGDPAGASKATQQSLISSGNGSARAPVKTEPSKLSQSGSFKILTREQNGTAHPDKDTPISPVSPPPAPVVSGEPQKKPFVSQKIKAATHDLPLLLQRAYGDKKTNARDKHRFFESLRLQTKSSNGSSSIAESGSPSPPSPVDFKQELAGVSNGASQNLLVENRESDSSSEPTDTGDEGSQVFLSESSLSSVHADSDDGYKRSHSCNEEASSTSEATEPGDEEDPFEDRLPADFEAFMRKLGWNADEQEPLLGLEEMARSVMANKELEQRLWSMESNSRIINVFMYIKRLLQETKQMC